VKKSPSARAAVGAAVELFIPMAVPMSFDGRHDLDGSPYSGPAGLLILRLN
jgi:hypothetical protein